MLYALVNANTAGWASAQTVGLLGLGVILLAASAWVEGKVRSPLVALGILRNAQVRGANIAMVLIAAAMIGMFFVLSLYQQDLEGYSALKAGLSGLPLGLVLITVAGLAGPVTERLGAKPVLLTGLAVFTAGVAWLSRIPLHGSYLADILGPSLIIAAGLGLAFVAVTIAAADGVETEHAGLAGGLINMTQQIGGAVGLAVLTAIATSHIHTGVHSAAAVNDGFRAALVLAAAIAGAAVLVTAVVLPGRAARPAARRSPPRLSEPRPPSRGDDHPNHDTKGTGMTTTPPSDPAKTLTEIVLPGVVDPNGLIVRHRPVPVPARGEALVELLATGVSFAEQGMRRNRYPGVYPREGTDASLNHAQGQ